MFIVWICVGVLSKIQYNCNKKWAKWGAAVHCEEFIALVVDTRLAQVVEPHINIIMQQINLIRLELEAEFIYTGESITLQ